jgi:hypothetical protein
VVAVSGEEVSVEEPTDGLALPTAEEAEAATATSTAVVATPTSESEETTSTEDATPTATTAPEMPGSGGILPTGGNFLIWVGVALLAVLLFGVWKQFKSSRTL